LILVRSVRMTNFDRAANTSEGPGGFCIHLQNTLIRGLLMRADSLAHATSLQPLLNSLTR
jgi:hypothetical protein